MIASRVAQAIATVVKVKINPIERQRTITMGRTADLWAPFRMVTLPIGYRNSGCPACGSRNIIGALLTPDADEADANVLCRDCLWVN